MCCPDISGTVMTTPTRVLETILYIHQIEILIRYEAAIAAMRLRKSQQITMGDSIEYRVIENKLFALCETLIPDNNS